MTVYRNVEFGLRVLRVSEKERRQRIESVLDVVRLGHLGSRYPRQLSGGQQQRTALARALVINPAILLLDEPFGALDRKLRLEMQPELKAIQRQFGITTVFVTHDQSEALALADRVVVMKDGLVEQVGSPRDIYEKPTTSFVADFMGTANMIYGTVTAVTPQEIQLTTPDGRTLFAAASPAARVGWYGNFVVRPEKVVLTAERVAGYRNSIAGRLKRVTYMGEFTNYSVAVSGQTWLIVSQNTSHERPPLVEDSEVHVHFDAASLIALRSDGDGQRLQGLSTE
jgi:putative spermidine/putrescine transport system ATP-binding protein/spermidine/putrescine transport system ATP-binding protein